MNTIELKNAKETDRIHFSVCLTFEVADIVYNR